MEDLSDDFDVITITRTKTDEIIDRKLDVVKFISFVDFLQYISNSPKEMYIRPYNKEKALKSLNIDTIDKKLHLAIYEKIIESQVKKGVVLGITPYDGKNVYVLLKEFLESDVHINELLNTCNNINVKDVDIFYCTR